MFFGNLSRSNLYIDHTSCIPKMTNNEITYTTVRFHRSSELQNRARPDETQRSREAVHRGKCFKHLIYLFLIQHKVLILKIISYWLMLKTVILLLLLWLLLLVRDGFPCLIILTGPRPHFVDYGGLELKLNCLPLSPKCLN